MKLIQVPVLVVGAGPAGLMAGLLLRRHGIAHRIVERRDGPQRAPAAHVVNARTLEILRQTGVDMDAIAAACTPPEDGGFVHWVTRLGGEVIGRVPFERQGEEMLALTPTPLRNLSQHRLEPILAGALEGTGAPPPAYHHEWIGATEEAGAVRSRIVDRVSGEEYEIASRYLLAADGAASSVRRWLGITPVGPERIQGFVMIHFEANLRELVRDCPGVLYWICDPEVGGTLVAHDIDREWVYMHAWDPEREPREHFTEALCERLVRRSIARDSVELRIRTISTWMMTAQIAERYRSGRVFLVGDAAHRFPPTGGLGLNTGVQDMHNLAWKIAAVLQGRAGESLLDTYEAERQPVAKNNAEQSLRNAFRMIEVPLALGVTEDRAASHARMQEVLADPDARRAVTDAIEGQSEHFDMIGLQLGFAYAAGALIDDEGDAPRQSAVREVVVSTRPGARLPHGWVEHEGRRVSTLDLIADGCLTLLVGPEGESWLAGEGTDPALCCLQIGRDVIDRAGWWTEVAGMPPGGALLVRPDQHVAFRSRMPMADPRAARRALRSASATILRSGGEAPS